jgi:hypothetical protein
MTLSVTPGRWGSARYSSPGFHRGLVDLDRGAALDARLVGLAAAAAALAARAPFVAVVVVAAGATALTRAVF